MFQRQMVQHYQQQAAGQQFGMATHGAPQGFHDAFMGGPATDANNYLQAQLLQ
jgi:hypothetical protein